MLASIALTVALACSVVSGAALNKEARSVPGGPIEKDCGGQIYNIAQATCYSRNRLCGHQGDKPTVACGKDCILESHFTCYDDKLPCAIIKNVPQLACGNACYLDADYGCQNGTLFTRVRSRR